MNDAVKLEWCACIKSSYSCEVKRWHSKQWKMFVYFLVLHHLSYVQMNKVGRPLTENLKCKQSDFSVSLTSHKHATLTL